MSAESARPGARGFRVMSFNVRGSVHDDGANAWRERAEANVETIERHAPDLIGFQEFQRGNLETYKETLPGYARLLGPRYGNRRPHSFNATFFDRTRLEPLDRGGFWLSETPGEHSRSWETRVARSANWVLFGLRETGLTFVHLNTHLDHKSGLARREGANLIVRQAEEFLRRHGRETPILATGDFNCRPGTQTYRTFVEAGFADTFLTAGNEDAAGANTFHAFKGSNYKDPRPNLGPRRIDWILLRDPAPKLRVRSHAIARDADDPSGVYPSDHYPILADLAPTDQP
jgi:endonuclease/exonuclease/phosphatase family metal-dependent hydrolase